MGMCSIHLEKSRMKDYMISSGSILTKITFLVVAGNKGPPPPVPARPRYFQPILPPTLPAAHYNTDHHVGQTYASDHHHHHRGGGDHGGQTYASDHSAPPGQRFSGGDHGGQSYPSSDLHHDPAGGQTSYGGEHQDRVGQSYSSDSALGSLDFPSTAAGAATAAGDGESMEANGGCWFRFRFEFW